MATASPFLGRNINTDSGNILNNPIISGDAYRELIAASVWGGLSVDVEIANSGLVTGFVNTGDSAVVKTIDVTPMAGTRQVRFAYQKEIAGAPATFGQQVAAQGDKNQFLYLEAEIAEIRSPLMPVHTDMEQRDGYNTLSKYGGSEALAQRNVRLWAGWQFDADHYSAMLRGASDAYLAPAIRGGLEKDIGGVIGLTSTPNLGAYVGTGQIGAPCSHENIVGFDGSGNTAIMQLTNPTAVNRGYHEDKLSNLVAQLQATASGSRASNAMNRNSVKGLYSLASRMNIRKIKGANYDYIWQLDWEAVDQLIGTLDNTTDSRYLVGLWKQLAANSSSNAKEKLFDVRYEDLVLDGVLLRPDRYLQGYRPTVIQGTAPAGGTTITNTTTDDVGRVLWTGGPSILSTTAQSSWYDLDKFRAYETNNGNDQLTSKSPVAVGFLLGDTALVKAQDGGLKMMEEEGDFETGKLYGSREWRTVRRAVWQGRDVNTNTILRNEGSILTLSCITGTVTSL